MSLVKAFAAALTLALAASTSAAQPPPACFSDWPAGASPAAVGKRVAGNFLARKLRHRSDPSKSREGVIYPEVITWLGALEVAGLTGDTELRDSLVRKFEPYLSEPGSMFVNQSAHVDYRVFGILPLEIHLQTRDERCLKLGIHMADAQWGKTTPDGITTEARYWIDDMYMIPALQVQAWRATRDTKYLDRAALTMCSYLDRLQKANGLFHHGENSPFYWGRGNGWFAAGSAELLSELPADHPRRARILAGYRRMMQALLENQAPSGLWCQLIDKPESWTETSGSAMFAFGMVTGVKHGWLPAETYGPAARKAWLALVARIDENANLRDVCVGTNKGFDESYYLARPRTTGDLHGQAPMLWTAAALLK